MNSIAALSRFSIPAFSAIGNVISGYSPLIISCAVSTAYFNLTPVAAAPPVKGKIAPILTVSTAISSSTTSTSSTAGSSGVSGSSALTVCVFSGVSIKEG